MHLLQHVVAHLLITDFLLRNESPPIDRPIYLGSGSRSLHHVVKVEEAILFCSMPWSKIDYQEVLSILSSIASEGFLFKFLPSKLETLISFAG